MALNDDENLKQIGTRGASTSGHVSLKGDGARFNRALNKWLLEHRGPQEQREYDNSTAGRAAENVRRRKAKEQPRKEN